ncbi:hypothetical protein HKD37_19G053470 [Glycine soja]
MPPSPTQCRALAIERTGSCPRHHNFSFFFLHHCALAVSMRCSLVHAHSVCLLHRKGPITRTMSKRLQEDWARPAEEGPRVLMNLRTHLLFEVVSPLSLPSPFRCHLSSKKQRNPLMKKILGLQAPMELASLCVYCLLLLR